jgi:hypothetical protein
VTIAPFATSRDNTLLHCQHAGYASNKNAFLNNSAEFSPSLAISTCGAAFPKKPQVISTWNETMDRLDSAACLPLRPGHVFPILAINSSPRGFPFPAFDDCGIINAAARICAFGPWYEPCFSFANERQERNRNGLFSIGITAVLK